MDLYVNCWNRNHFITARTAQRERRPSAEEQKLLEVAARREGLDASRLQVFKSTTVALPLTGRRVQVAKVLNPDNGKAFSVSLDEQGQEIEFSNLKAEEQRVHRARYGKLDPKLHRKIEATRGDEKIKVAFWLLNPTEDLDRNDPRDGRTDLTAEEVDALLARRTEQVKSATSRATEGLTRALERAGHVVGQRGEGAPMVFATLPAGLVKQVLERADVQVAYLTQDEVPGDHMNVAGVLRSRLINCGISASLALDHALQLSRRAVLILATLLYQTISARACPPIQILAITRLLRPV